MPKTTKKTIKQPTVTVHIALGRASEHQKRLMRAFFTRLIAECQGELKAESEAKK